MIYSYESYIQYFRMIYTIRRPMLTIAVCLLLCGEVAIGQTRVRSIPVEYSCNRLPYIVKDKDLQFSYSADHLTERNCIITITAQDKICVNFVQYYLDCETDIIFASNDESTKKETYRCDSDHSADVCSTDSTLEIIFQRKKKLHKDGFGYVELSVYSKGKSAAISGSVLTVIIVIGGIFGLILLIVVAALLLSRALYRLNYKTTLGREQRHEEYPLHGEVPSEPPPPYTGPVLEQENTIT